jgi:NAD(P)-dependent dehydrogenase (short-subunit alcohol dehydrogenase family)
VGSFDGRTALVTGSTQGVGRATALRLAREGAAGIVVCGRDRRRGVEVVGELRGLGTEAAFLPVDLEQPDSCRALVAAARRARERGRLEPSRGRLDTDVALFDDSRPARGGAVRAGRRLGV